MSTRGQRSNNYKPVAICLPILLVFGAVLAICIGLIEGLLHQTANVPLEILSGSTSTNHKKPIERRYANESCQALPAITSTLSDIDKSSTQIRSTALESIYSVIDAGTTKMDTDQWNSLQQLLQTVSAFDSIRSREARCLSVYMTKSSGLLIGTIVVSNNDGCNDPFFSQWFSMCLNPFFPGGCEAGHSSMMMTITSNTPITNIFDTRTPGPLTTSAADQPSTTIVPSAATLSTHATLASQTLAPSDNTWSTDLSTISAQLIAVAKPSDASQSSIQTPLSENSGPHGPPGASVDSPSTQRSNENMSRASVGSIRDSSGVSKTESSVSTGLRSEKSDIESSRSTSGTSSATRESSTGGVISTSRRYVPLGASESTPVSNVSNVSNVPSSQSWYTVTMKLTTVVTTTDAQGHVTSFTAVALQPTVLITSPRPDRQASAKPSAPTSTFTINRAPLRTLTSSEEIVNRTFDKFSYVAALWIPSVLAVLIKVIWEIIYSSFVLIEPFRQLSRVDGAPASALFSHYLSSCISLGSLRSCFLGHKLSALAMSEYLLVTTVTMLAAPSMTVVTRDTCQIAPDQYMRCDPVWVINTVVLRCIESLLIVSVVLVFGIAVLTRSHSYKTGVATNPSAIATIASLLSQEPLLQEFRAVDVDATKSELAASVAHNRYRLGWHENVFEGAHYGIVQHTDPVSDQQPLEETVSIDSHGHDSPLSRKAQMWTFDIVQLMLTVCLLVLITSYRFDFDYSDALNSFFNSNHFGPRLIFVILATIVDMQWKSLESEVRILDPYRRMAKGLQRSETTVLLNLNGTCWTGLVGSIKRTLVFGDTCFQTLVSLLAVLSDFNIIAVAGVVWFDGQTPISRDVTSYFAMTVTGFMVIVMLAVIFWWRRGTVREMPVSPNTIGAVIFYLCASRFAKEMSAVSLHSVSQRDRDNMVNGQRFSFRMRVGVDGQEGVSVDFDDSSASSEEKTRHTKREALAVRH